MKKSSLKFLIESVIVELENMIERDQQIASKIASSLWKDVYDVSLTKELAGESFFNIQLKSGQKQSLKKGKDGKWYYYQSTGEWPAIKNAWIPIPNTISVPPARPSIANPSTVTAKSWDPVPLGQLKMKETEDYAIRNSEGTRECPMCGSPSGESEDGYCPKCMGRDKPEDIWTVENVGYSHGNIGGIPPRDPVNEYSDQQTRSKAIESRPDDALKLIYAWVQQRIIDYREFVILLGSVESQRKGCITDLEPRWNKSSGQRGQP